MIRKIIQIDEEKCDGCGLCAKACEEGAIAIVDGKAKLLRDDYCDGLGNCLPACPAEAITFTVREAAAYEEAAVQKNISKGSPVTDALAGGETANAVPQGIPTGHPVIHALAGGGTANAVPQGMGRSLLRQWPVQIRLAPASAPYFEGADLLIAADCTAYAYGSFHEDFIRGRVTLIGCPKLDAADYSEKLTEIFRRNSINSITVARMEVPCCGGIEYAVKQAVENSGREIPTEVKVITTEGEFIHRKEEEL